MLKKLRRRVKTIVSNSFKKKPRRQQQPPTVSPTPPSSPTTSPPQASDVRPSQSRPFLFPPVTSSVLPDPSPFFSPRLLSSPLPTNSFFQNFVLKAGDQPEFFHPYAIKSSQSSLTVCFPSQFKNSAFVYQIFNPDLTISTLDCPHPETPHVISSFDDLSVTLEFPANNLRFFLVRGSPFLTCNVRTAVSLSITTIHAIIDFVPNASCTKYTIKLNNNQTWLIYASSAIKLSHDLNRITSTMFSGVIRIAALPDANPRSDSVLDQFSSCYPVSGNAVFTNSYCLEYKWDKRGWGDLLMLAHPLHLQLLSGSDCAISVIDDFKYTSIDGDLVGIVGDSWVLKTDPVSVTWHSIRGIPEDSVSEIVELVVKDVETLRSSPITTTSSYFYGKLIARAARLALIAEEVCFSDVIPGIRDFLKETIEPWMEGNFAGNGFLYDAKWGGIVTKQGSMDSGADFGFGVYNDHHYHLGYFVYAIAVLAKIDPAWGRKYRRQAYSLMADFMTLSRHPSSSYPRLRCFDLWKLHSWAGGLTEFGDGRNQESSSEAVNAYYSVALMGLAYGDSHLVSTGSTILALEIQAAKTWWHVKEGGNLYPEAFTSENRVVGVLWANKRDSGLWFAPGDWRECRLGIQLLPIVPVSEALFSDMEFVRQLVRWALPALERRGVGEGWKGFVYALQAIYDKEGAMCNVRKLSGHDEGNTMANLMWWIHSRNGGNVEDEECDGDGGKLCWYRHYYH